jgi:nucleoside 2-deoxyribosyltransferase
VYLAGPPHADEYRRRAIVLVRRIGWEPVDPMRRDYRGQTQGREAEIVEGDLAEIRDCDAVLAAFTSPDEGTAMEAWYAHTLGKPVIAYTGGAPPHPWTVYVADVICDELERAVQALSGSRPAHAWHRAPTPAPKQTPSTGSVRSGRSPSLVQVDGHPSSQAGGR